MSGNLQLLAGALARAKQENRAALITGTTAGFPTVDGGIAAASVTGRYSPRPVSCKCACSGPTPG